ncbi:MAG: hypothetical protein ABUS47_02865 [Steroidobacter sp.]
MITLVGFLVLLLAKPSFAAENPSTEELYVIFRQARLALSQKGPVAMVNIYSREMLETALDEAFRVGKYPSTDYDHVKDVLWEIFERIGRISAIYSKSLSPTNRGTFALRMEVLLQHCDTPAVVTVSFVREGKEWKIDGFNWDYRPSLLGWYSEKLTPVETFPIYVGLSHSTARKKMFRNLGIDDPDSDCSNSKQ